MFKHIFNMFRKAKKVEETSVVKSCPRSKEQKLDAILLSYKYGKIKHEAAVSLIYVWSNIK